MPDADPILASNPLDTRTPDYAELAVMYGELWRKAAHLQAVADANVAIAQALRRPSVDEAQTRAALETTIVTLRESAEFDAEMRRSLSASVEELRMELARAQESAASWERRYQAEHADWRTAMDVANLMERQRDEARAEATTASKSSLARTAERDRAMSDLAAAVLREREECAAEVRIVAARAQGQTGPGWKDYVAACEDAEAAIRARSK